MVLFYLYYRNWHKYGFTVFLSARAILLNRLIKHAYTIINRNGIVLSLKEGLCLCYRNWPEPKQIKPE